MINVLIIDLGRDYGGAEKVIENLLFYDYKDINMHLVALKNTKFSSILEKRKVKSLFIENDKKKILKSLFKVKKYIEDNKIDIIHAHGVTSEIFGVLLSKITNCKLVTTIHSRADFDTTNKIKGNTYCFIQKRLLSYNEKYIVVSESLKEFFLNDKGIKAEKIDVIKNGIKALEKKDNLKSSTFTLSTIGRLTPVKAHKKLLEALKDLKKEGVPFKCIIAGEGELEEELKLFVAENNIGEEVKFFGFAEDIRDIFDKSDCLVIHSDMEGLPITLLEAMSYKVPLIVYKVGGIKKVLKSNECIELKSNEPKDILKGIKEFINKDKKEIEDMVNNSLINFKNNYDLDIFIKKHELLYKEVKGEINEKFK